MDLLYQAINKAISYGAAFYAYRMPNGKDAVFHAIPEGCTVDCLCGFRISPFDIDGEHKEVIIPKGLDAKTFLDYECHTVNIPDTIVSDVNSTTFEEYADEFNQCKKILDNGTVNKIVLSKVTRCDFKGIDWGGFFKLMEKRYPTAFVFIFQSPDVGAWAGASPETLARHHNSIFKTMALAGTKPIDCGHDWSKKEIDEQRYVSGFIEDALRKYHFPFSESITSTISAGNICHLCNYFSAYTDNMDINPLIKEIHPTPALCGLPKGDSKQAILQIEHHDRSYYGGYIGPFSPEGFDYFVNLRSVNFNRAAQILFTGGGLTVDSRLRSEWQETEIKTETIMSILKESDKSK